MFIHMTINENCINKCWLQCSVAVFAKSVFLPLSRRSMYSAACSNVSMFISNIFTCFRYCRGRAMSTRASTTLIARQVNSRHTAVAVQLSAVRSCAAVIIAAPLSCRLPPVHGPTLLTVQLGWQQHSGGEISLASNSSI